MFNNDPKPLAVEPNKKVEPNEQQPVFWFKKKNGQVFCTQENEAWNLLKGRSRIGNVPLQVEYLGRSTGELYFEGRKELEQIFEEKGIKAAQEHLHKLHEIELSTADVKARPRNMDGMGDPTALRELNTGNISL